MISYHFSLSNEYLYSQLLYLMCQFMQIIIQHCFQLSSMDAHKWITLNPWSSIIYNLFASPLKEVGRSKGASYQHTKIVIVFLVETHHMLYNVYYNMIFKQNVSNTVNNSYINYSTNTQQETRDLLMIVKGISDTEGIKIYIKVFFC